VFHADGTEPETRFKLLFETTTGVEETAEDKPFVFVSDGNIIVSNNGEATLQVIDVTGRVLGSETINGNFSKAINVPGVYVLRLINGNEVRTQKIIIE
jgi:outer membrane protein assembly factor BamB